MASTDAGSKAYRKARVACVAILAAGIAACTRDTNDAPDPPWMLEPPVGVYSGVFPCDDCPGIPTTVWVRGDGIYFLEQTYPARGAVTSLGLWDWLADTKTLELSGAGPPKHFRRPDRDTLVMQTPSPQEHRVTRDRARGRFDRAIALEGSIDPKRDGAVLTECITGRRLPIAHSGDYSSFARQYRHLGAGGSPVFVAFEARFVWRDDGALEAVVVDRFITIREEGRC